MEPSLANLARKVTLYREILQNTETYRKVWTESLRDHIIDQLRSMAEQAGLAGYLDVRGEMENLEAVVFSLGDVKSGVYQQIGENIQRDLIKHNGSLIYQQLFNGKVIVLINYPYIESYGEPRPPKTIAIYRPEELRDAFFIRHLEEFLTEITNWEDFDDDEPIKRIGFNLNFPVGGEPQEDKK